MIPSIGMMIGGYIIFRCLEALCRNSEAFSSRGARTFIQVMAVLGILVTGFLVLDLMLGGTTSIWPLSSALPQISPNTEAAADLAKSRAWNAAKLEIRRVAPLDKAGLYNSSTITVLNDGSYDVEFHTDKHVFHCRGTETEMRCR